MSDIQEQIKLAHKRAEENDIRHFILETKDYGNFDVVEYEKYKELQEENNNLKKLKERYQLEKEIYKSRNEKAIKCIKNKYYKEEYERKGTFTNKLMNILQGVDKE